MRCLYCGKIIDEKTPAEIEYMWHTNCVRKFFGTDKMPMIELSDSALQQLASETIDKRLTVTGVQKKLSLHLSKGTDARLTIVDYPTGYILKPQTMDYSHLPKLEHLSMRLARMVGIDTVDFGLIRVGNDYAYITRRVDRIFSESGDFRMLAMEDFCQLSERLTMDKYRGSYEKCGRLVSDHSSRPGIDLSEMFMRIVFSFIIGNSDMHLKNFSLIEDAPASRRYVLSPAYDMLPVNLILPEDTEETALTLNGKKRRLKNTDFRALAVSYGIPAKAADKMITHMCSFKERMLKEIFESILPAELSEQMMSLVEERIEILMTK